MKNQNVLNKIRQHVITNYKKINPEDMVLGEAFYNQRCHLNSVQKVKEGKATKVFLCFAIDRKDNSQCVHFINQTEDGKYADNTWGWLCEQSDYYLIREIDESEYDNIWDILQNTKKSLFNTYATWFDKYILRIKYNII